MTTTLNTINLSASDAGRGQPLVFVHGFPLSGRAWKRQGAEFRSSHRVITPNLRGVGKSNMLPGTITMAQYAADLNALLQRLTTGPVVLIGHSMGGYVALAYARAFPEMLRGLVLVGTKAGPDTDKAAEARRATAEKVREEGVQVVCAAMLPKMLSAERHDVRMAAQVQDMMVSSTKEGVIGALLGMAERPDSTAQLAQIAVPTLVIAGAKDDLIPPSESEKMASAIHGAQISLIADAGHLVAFEQPETFNAILRKWLEQVGLTSMPDATARPPAPAP